MKQTQEQSPTADRRKRGGFTLVELIVVLVILAILATLLVPALTGYIEKAKDAQVIACTRNAVMAAQTLVNEDYAAGVEVSDGVYWWYARTDGDYGWISSSYPQLEDFDEEQLNIFEEGEDILNYIHEKDIKLEGGKIISLTYRYNDDLMGKYTWNKGESSYEVIRG